MRPSKLRRNEHGYFEDNDLAELLFNAIEEKAGSPGGRRVPGWAREHEIQKLKHARQANVCTLNEYRQLLGLKRAFISVLSSFPVSLPHL
jgi:linoleate 10R-lipoxygenase